MVASSQGVADLQKSQGVVAVVASSYVAVTVDNYLVGPVQRASLLESHS